MHIVRNPTTPPTKPFVEFKVALARDGKTVYGQVLFARWTSDRTVEFSKAGYGVRAEDAWERAKAEAERIGAELIVVTAASSSARPAAK